MPKFKFLSNKKSYTLLKKDRRTILIARKQPEMPMTDEEKDTLRDIYHESLNRITQAKALIEQYRDYIDLICSDNELDNNKHFTIESNDEKDFRFLSLKLVGMTIENGDPEIVTTAKKLKRHFHLDPKTAPLDEYRAHLNTIIDKIERVEKGLHAEDEPVCVSNMSRKKIENNVASGYVYKKLDSEGNKRYNFGDIYLDMRLLTTSPDIALGVFIHEASHRYAYTGDISCYEDTRITFKEMRLCIKRYTADCDTIEKAIDNADSYSYFIRDITGLENRKGFFDFYTNKKDKPDWWQEATYDAIVSQENNGASKLVKWGLFATTATIAIGGYYLYKKGGGEHGDSSLEIEGDSPSFGNG